MPVPDSPCTSTGAMPRATLVTSSRTWPITAEPPDRRCSAATGGAGTAAATTPTAIMAARGGAGTRPSAEATTLRNWRRSTGLVR